MFIDQTRLIYCLVLAFDTKKCLHTIFNLLYLYFFVLVIVIYLLFLRQIFMRKIKKKLFFKRNFFFKF
jgi:hypothetical protein